MRRDYLRHRPSPIVAVLLVLAVAVLSFPSSAAPLSAGINDLTQLDYRWYDNVDAEQPTTALAGENAAVTGSNPGAIYHLRVNVDNSGAKLDPGAGFKLQYGTSTGGPWTDAGAIGSGEAWRGYDNTTPADADPLSSVLLASSFDGASQTYEEANDATTINTIGKNKAGEWAWVVQNNQAAGGTTYYFRIVQSGGTPLAGYTNYPEIATAVPAPQATQEDYRWYQNIDAVQPTTALAGENSAISDTTDATAYRLRINLEIATVQLPSGESFKLQYSVSTGGPWTDVGGIGAGEIWRGLDNASVADGTALSATLLGASNVVETYEEANNSAATPSGIPVGQTGEWDWVVQQNGASQLTTYYFRMVESDGTAINGYTRYPTLTTAGPKLQQDAYRWYQNSDAVQPSTALAAENTAAGSVASGDVLRLRLSLVASTTATAAGESFKLQYAGSTDGPWTDVGGLGSAAIWRGYDNPTPADGAPLTANLLSGATILETYEEANSSSATPNPITVGNAAE